MNIVINIFLVGTVILLTYLQLADLYMQTRHQKEIIEELEEKKPKKREWKCTHFDLEATKLAPRAKKKAAPTA